MIYRRTFLLVAFEDIIYAYLQARKNKRRSHDSVVFELNQEQNLVRLWKSVNNRTLDTTDNYTFVAKEPHIREIFATAMSVRVIHHYLEWRLRPIYEKLLPRNSFNNRKNMGLHKAIAKVRRDIRRLSYNYDPSADTWIIHLDFKGFFPNADVEVALKQQLDIIDTYYFGYDKDDLKYMMSSVMRSDPARHCRRLGSIRDWDIIPNGKSLFDKPVGIGGAIGSMVSYDRLLCSVNTYACIFRDNNNYKERILFKNAVLSNFGDYLEWNAKKTCFALQNKFIFKARMLKFFGKPEGG